MLVLSLEQKFLAMLEYSKIAYILPFRGSDIIFVYIDRGTCETTNI